jgi:putative ubiquitin-RnfH superfamily antitoxin RatB of RatAB toxin-antitoxin module
MGTLKVEVVYALPRAQEVIVVDLAPGATVADAIEASGLSGKYPSLRAATLAVGIHGRVVTPTHAVADGDRVEIYRPLVADPMTARRQRAKRS